MNKNRQTHTISFDIQGNAELDRLIEEARHEYEDSSERVRQEFEQRFNEFFEYNRESLDNPEHPEDFRKWIRNTLRTTFLYASVEAWNQCQRYHEEHRKP